MPTATISANFKKRAWRAVFSILLFIAVYLLLFALALAICAGLGVAALALITFKITAITVMLGLALFACGIAIVIFMIKFIFSKNTSDYSDLTPIDISSEPKLEAMIRELVDEIGTSFPKKIFLSHEVNASVFYDSGFWSMFLPVKKNLHIGLGLVNSTTVSELRGILAHEFGHFSQKSMKVGSYVYNLNRVIYNMLYENESYDTAIASWSSRSGYFAVVSWMAIAYNKGVQFTLRSMYQIVNRNYLALSREMEFHADSVAVQTVGTNSMIRSMLRMEIAALSMSKTIGHYNEQIADSIFTDNIFPRQHAMMLFLAENNKIPLKNGLPEMEQSQGNKMNFSKLNIEDQWASHPSDDDRIGEFRRAAVSDIKPDDSPAGTLFKDIEATQKHITNKLFADVRYRETPRADSIGDFTDTITANYLASKFPDIFNGYYDAYNPEVFDVKNHDAASEIIPIEKLFASEMVDIVGERNAMLLDSDSLKSMSENKNAFKTFDYDGVKYKVGDAANLRGRLESSLISKKETLDKNDKQIFGYFYHVAKRSLSHYQLLELYAGYFKLDTDYEQKFNLYYEMNADFSFAYQTMQHDAIRSRMSAFLRTEDKFRESLREMCANPLYDEAKSNEAREAFNDYLSAGNPDYFHNGKYDDEAIGIKNKAVDFYVEVLQQSYFIAKKKLLDFKAQLLENA